MLKTSLVNALRILLFFLILISASLIFIAIIAPARQTIVGYPVGESEYKLLGHICHQYPTRCIWILNRPMALCTRCIFGYFGLIIGLLKIFKIGPFVSCWRIAALGFIIFIISIIDPVCQLLTNYESSNFARAITGSIGGFALSLILFPFQQTRRPT